MLQIVVKTQNKRALSTTAIGYFIVRFLQFYEFYDNKTFL